MSMICFSWVGIGWYLHLHSTQSQHICFPDGDAGKMTSLVTLYDAVGCFDQIKKELNPGFWLGCMSPYVSVTGVGVAHFFLIEFFRFWSRWPMVAVMNLSRYLVTYAAVNTILFLTFLVDMRHVEGT